MATVFNTSYTNKAYNQYVRDVLGPPFSLVEKIKRNGVGTGRLTIAAYSKTLESKKHNQDANYGNIALRRQGIILHFTRGLNRYSWPIPYNKLVVFSDLYFTIHADGTFIAFFKDRNYLANTKNISKMMRSKNQYMASLCLAPFPTL